MSSIRNFSVNKLTSLWPRSTTDNGVDDSWMDKSTSLPNLAKPNKTTSFSDPSDNVCEIDDSVKTQNDLKKKTQRFIRSLRLKSLSKQQRYNHKLITSDEDRPKGTNNVTVHVTNSNDYDKFPGSDLEKRRRGSNNEVGECASCSNAVTPAAIGRHQFSSSRIGYINPKKNGHEGRTQGITEHHGSPGLYDSKTGLTDSDPRGNITHVSSTSLDDTACIRCSDKVTQGNSHKYSDLECTTTKELHDRLKRTNITVSTDSLRSVSSDGSEIFPQVGSSVANVYQQPPARPPKPPSLRGRPLVESRTTLEDDDDDDDYEVPPRPPAREPTTRRSHAVRSIPLMNDCRFSGTYETINDSPPVPQVPEFGLPGELRKLPHQPWYWGPLTQEQAEAKLRGLPDGYFLVRDSSDDRYLLSLSFNSNGRPVHTRFEYVGGHFSINDSQGYTSVIDLIEEAVRESQNGVYSFMQNINGTQTFPARLTHPVSRFTEMKSLQHLCRFVIRETFPRHYVADLPVPEKIRKYILENQY